MIAHKLLPNRYHRQVLLLAAMLLVLVGASPATAQGGASEFNIQATVSVVNLDLACVSPSPITPAIRFNGNFVIQAHIVLPPSPVTPPSPIIAAGTIVTLHLDATGINGVGLTDGTLYQGSQGTSQNFVRAPSTMLFNTAFNLVPSQPNQLPPSPICPAQVAFQVQLYATEVGFPAISASLTTPD